MGGPGSRLPYTALADKQHHSYDTELIHVIGLVSYIMPRRKGGEGRGQYGSSVIMKHYIYYVFSAMTHAHTPTAESYVGKAQYLVRIRYHGKGMFGRMHKYYAHYFLKLREGPPPPKKKKRKEDLGRYKTKRLIEAGPRSIPNSL